MISINRREPVAVMSWLRSISSAACLAAVLGIVAQAGAQATRSVAAPANQVTRPSTTGTLFSSGVGEDGQIHLHANKSAILNTVRPYKRISIGQPDIAEVNGTGPASMLLTAKKPGTTQLIVWDDEDRSQMVDVTVTSDLTGIGKRMDEIFPSSRIEVTESNGTIILTGQVRNLAVAEQASALAEPYGDKVLNLLEVSGGQQVMLQVRFAEVSRSASSALGINGAYASGSFSGGSNIGQINPTSLLPGEDSLVGDTPTPQGLLLTADQLVNPSVTLYGAGQIGSFYLEYFISALRQNNLLRMLAEPNLIAISGQEASFLAGGEFPIPVTQGGGSAGTVAITIEYREFGVKLIFVPVVLGDGRIRLKVEPEVSDLDFTTAVRFSGFVVPGLSTRKVSTTVELAEGQTFAIAGLLNNTMTSSSDVTPLLGDIPIIGTLFRSVRYQRKETELVVLVTPRLVEGMMPNQVPTLPGERWRHPSENELFFDGDLGAPEPEPEPGSADAPGRNPRRFYGQYGFSPAAQPVTASE